ncbi:MAG: phenylalanine--tRNA ligase subunit alpha [Rickettsiales bacterium]|nr:phenylalanine--tRNA ligase subunit alpha [Rickettsiales bacterium]|tara:strand:+ start:169 stop:1209 length:1041 start_codon:yes stop_codon:yes gene_type:complete
MNLDLPQQSTALAKQAADELGAAQDKAELARIKSSYLGRNGSIAALLRAIPGLPSEQRRDAGRAVNEAKKSVEVLFMERQEALRGAALSRASQVPVDPTLPGRRDWHGHSHPVTQAWDEICDIFSSMGYSIQEGPEVETDWHCFEALNIPQGHPAREMQDTFYIEEKVVLRTHTSPVQVRSMLSLDPPMRVICPGVVYRRDNDLTHTPMFHQVEGLVVDDRVTMADLKGTLSEFARAFFGPGTKVRFRPSYFPFTEPSAEVDVSCVFCKGEGAGCRVCKDTGWLEVLGAGMVDPAVFAEVGRPEYDPDKVQGFAFGMGIDRLAMLRYGIGDLRMLFENDVRLLEQF